MLSNISWQQYFVTLLVATILYYLFVWIVFFKAKLSLLPAVSGLHNFSVHSDDEPDEVMTTAQHVIDEVRPIFDGRENKNELIRALQLSLKKYAAWEEPGFRETINEFIAVQSKSKCSIRLEESDLRAVWLQA